MKRTFGWLLAGAIAVAGCAPSGSSSRLAVRATAGGSAATSGADGGTGAGLDLGNGITLTEVRMVVRRVLLEQAAAPDAGVVCGECQQCTGCKDEVCQGCAQCDHCEANEEGTVKFGPFLVDLAGADLAGGIHAVFDSDVPPGDYDRVKFVIASLDEEEAGGCFPRMDGGFPGMDGGFSWTDGCFPKIDGGFPGTDGGAQATDGGLPGGLQSMQQLHASIAIDGTIDGAGFEFTTPMRVAQERDGPFQVTGSSGVLILSVDPTAWFTGDQGERLDPRARPDRGEILENLRCSIRVLSDGDRDHRPYRCEPSPPPPSPDGGADAGL